MKRLDIGKDAINASEISLGCMRISGMNSAEAANLIAVAMDCGIDFFDHADIYGGGHSEEVFAIAVKDNKIPRDKLIIQSKCGIRSGFFDFSKEHIIESVEKSLKRLNTDYLDTLLLHRPDTLCEPEEVAEAFSGLFKQGKVRHFGVSNQNPGMIKLLSKYVQQPLIINQLQISLTNTGMIDSGLNVNMSNAASVNHDGGILEFCRLKDITIQPWSPFQYGFFNGTFLNNDKFPELNKKIDEIAEKYNVSNMAIAIAWLLRHPAKMQPIIGTTNAERVKAICKASDVELSRLEWYELYRSAGNILP